MAKIKSNLVSASPTRNMFQRIFSMMRAGFMFGGKRNLYEVYGYPRQLSPEDLLAKYERQDITTRVTDAPPEETWAYPPIIVTKDNAFQKAWKAFIDVQVVDLWPALFQVDRLLSFGEFSVLWIGLPGTPDSPAGSSYKPENIAYMHSYGALSAVVDKWDAEKTSPRYGLPSLYQLKTSDSNLSDRVHFSRIVHIVDRPLQGKSLGIPRLDIIYNLLDDILKIGGGSAETFWLTANRGLQVDIDKDMDLKSEDAEALSDELEEFQHQLRRYIRTRGVKITNIGSDVADPSGVFGVLIALLAATTGIPQRILMGAEAGQLASEQDRANWAELIAKRRINFAEPYVLRPLIARFQSLGILPKTNEPIQFEWPSAFHQSPLEVAQTQAQFARSIVNASRQTQYGFPIATLKEIRLKSGLTAEVEAGDELPKAFKAEPKTPFGGSPAKPAKSSPE